MKVALRIVPLCVLTSGLVWIPPAQAVEQLAQGGGSAVDNVSSVVNAVVGRHQDESMALLGSYGLQKYLLANDSVSPTGISSGAASLDKAAWMKGFGSRSNQGMRNGIDGYRADVLGAVIGVDGKMNNHTLVGLSFGGANVRANGGGATPVDRDSDVNQVTVYGALMEKAYYMNGSLGYAHGSTRSKRTTVGGMATGDYDSDAVSASLGAGTPKDFGTFALIPQANLTYSHIASDSYTETGNSPLTVTPGKQDILHLTAGVEAKTQFRKPDYTLATGASLMVDWDITQEQAASYAGSGTAFQIDAAKPAALGGIGGLILDFASNDGLYGVTVGYTANVRPDFISHTGEIRFRKSF